MKSQDKRQAIIDLQNSYRKFLGTANTPVVPRTGFFQRYSQPVLTAEHVPPAWRYDFSGGGALVERLGINAVFNAGAIKLGSEYYIAARVEGADRKSFFAIAKSTSPVDQFEFFDYPAVISELNDEETNVYDMRLVQHEDGWIYGIFCVESKDPKAPAGDTSSAVAEAGIVRTKDLKTWQRLANLKTPSPQQRNVVLHPEFDQRQIRLLYAPAGRLYRNRQRRRNRLGTGRQHGKGPC
jgi:4-O-beta-D-mannosyl-D-glucose phosphorylase